jgi:hypothetical protein
MCVGYLDPCGRGEHEWDQPSEATFKHCKRCGLVQFLDDSSETLHREVEHWIRSLKWKRKAIEAGKYAQWLSPKRRKELIEAINEAIVCLESRDP